MVSRPVSTYSIVAVDRKAGQMGVAVQSHWFSVGSVVTWGEPGVGVVATQAFAEPGYGPKGLAMMSKGKTPADALATLLKKDPRPEIRQVAMLDAAGRVAVHTGSKCLPHAGDAKGSGFSAQANLMVNGKVWPSMAESFSGSRGPLSERLMLALEAAEEAGGDLRGRQSAAMLIVSTKPNKEAWKGRLLELRVEDHPAPLKELRRLIAVHDAYDHANRGDELVAEKKFAAALKEYSLAAVGAPRIEELKFWQGVTLLEAGRTREALPLLARAFKEREEWRGLLEKLPEYGLLHVKSEVLRSIISPDGQ